MPRNRVLTESDGPFARLNGASLLPWESRLAVDELSKLWSVPIKTADQILLENLQELVTFSESP